MNDLNELLEGRLALSDRLPEENNLEELYALRDAWNDVDRYELIGASAKITAKVSYIVLLVLGIAAVIVSVLVGAGYFKKSTTQAILESITNSEGNSTNSTNSNSGLAGYTLGDAIAFGVAVFSTFCACKLIFIIIYLFLYIFLFIYFLYIHSSLYIFLSICY